jgi:hypothetical protein
MFGGWSPVRQRGEGMSDYSTRWLRDHLVALIDRVDALGQRTRWLRDHLVALIDRVDALEQRMDGQQCACGDAHVDTCQGCAAPVPEWRQLVNDERRDPKADALADVLEDLSVIASARDDYPPYGELARIVAVCEAQVGDGWQADPSEWPMTPNLTTLLVYLTDSGYGEPRWANLANAAAAWLRDLTDGGDDE